jgi:hypothetical protein
LKCRYGESIKAASLKCAKRKCKSGLEGENDYWRKANVWKHSGGRMKELRKNGGKKK